MQPTRLTWIGGEHDFALPIGGLRAVQDVCNAGPLQILVAFRAGTWRVDYPFAVLRHGLIGGGMEKVEAQRTIDALADHHPIIAFVITAQLVLAAAIMGVADDPVGEPEGATSPPENSSSAAST